MRFRVCLSLLCLVSGMMSSVAAQLPVIQLHALSRSVFQPGEEGEIHVTGASIEEVSELRFSHPGISAELISDPPRPFEETPVPKYGHFRLRVNAAVPPGRYEARALGRFGLSNPRSLLIAKQAEFVTDVGHDANSQAKCELGVLYHRHASPQRSDVYWVDVSPGQVISVGLLSEVIDSRLRGSVSVSDETGAVIESAVGDASGDVKRRVAIPAGVARVAITVEDLLYRGGTPFGYVLAVTDDDHATKLEDLYAPLHARCLSAQFRNPQGVEESTDPIRLGLPAVVESEFGSAYDEDQYVCTLEKGQTLMLSCFSDRLGEPADPRIVVHRLVPDGSGNDNWQRVANGDDCQAVSDSAVNLNSRDTDLAFTAPEKGDYRITVSDQDTGEFLSINQRYVLSIGPSAKVPILVAYHVYPHRDINTSRPAGIQIPRGGSAVLRVFALRRGFAGPINVAARSLPKGLTCHSAVIPPDRNQTDLVLISASDTPSSVQVIDVVGKFGSGEASQEAVAVPASVLWEKNGQQPKIRTRVIDELFVRTTDQDALPVKVALAGDQAIEVVKGNKVKVPFKLERHDGTKNNFVLRARNLPPGVKAGDLNIGGDKTDAEWTIDVTAGTKPGTYSFWAQTETKVKFAVNPQSLSRETEYQEKLKKLRADPSRADEHADLDKELAGTNKRIEAIKKLTTPRDFTIFVATPTITLKVNDK